MKPVNITTQLILFLIPVAGYLAWYRIGKIWNGVGLNLGFGLLVVPLFMFPQMLLYQNFLFLAVTVMAMAIKMYFLVKWSKEHNELCTMSDKFGNNLED
tara:strand:- start:47 stop:343 length:297 start_codon:yes stop_codon:yes gene_type:complete